MKKIITIFASLFLGLSLGAQGFKSQNGGNGKDLALARQYFKDQAYEKVIDRLEDRGKTSNQPEVYELLFDSYLELEKYRSAIRLSRDWANRIPARRAVFQVDEYFLHLQKEDEKDAGKLFIQIDEALKKNPGQAYAYGKAFSDRGYPKQALAVYQEALRHNSNMNFDYQMALLYGELGDIPNMHLMYLQMVERTPGYLATVKSFLARSIQPGVKDENLDKLKQEIVSRIQKGAPKRFNELLIHIFSQEGNFRAAFTQLRALDRQEKLQGNEISNLAKLAFNSDDFNLAIRIYDYEKKKGPENPFYQSAVIGWLGARKKSLESELANSEAWEALAEDFEIHQQEFRGDPYQAEITLPLSAIYAYRLQKPDTAEALLRSLFGKSWIGPEDQALAQIAYADLLLFTGKRWDAILYYKRAERALDQSVIGQEAKFKRAKAAYFVGDFEWAQGIFSVLKESTSKLIANDAMQYSLLITDNMALDSTTDALEAYARADFYYYREMYDSALVILEALNTGYSDHPIADESLFLRGLIKEQQNQLGEAIEIWQELVDLHGEDILADDALFRIGRGQEELLNKEAAMLAYEQLFTVHVDSFYASEARKAYRRLRGDALN